MKLLHTTRPRRPRVDVEAVDVAIVAAPVVAGGAVGALTAGAIGGWYRTLEKPAWNPPDRIFGPVWTTLYLLMGLAAALVAREGRKPSPRPGDVDPKTVQAGLAAFVVQLVLNLGWSLVFFRARRLRLAFAELVALWIAIAVTTVAFARVRIVAGLLLVPYLAWTTFAGVLNLDIARRNPHG